MTRMRKGLVLGLLAALALAGCGGARKGNGVATAGSAGQARASATPTTGGDDHGIRFSQCMRANGVPDFPDPKVGTGGGISIDAPAGADPTKVDAAMQKCKPYLPNGGEPTKADPAVVAQLRKFSQCMRDHGVPKFPDPTDEGLQVDNSKLGIDPESPTFKAAEQACQKYQPAPPSGGAGQGLSTGGNG
jgi:hypothetical protein